LGDGHAQSGLRAYGAQKRHHQQRGRACVDPGDERKTASDFDPRLLDLYDQYCHGEIGRRQFITAAGQFAVAGVSGAALVEMLMPDYALAQQVKPDDPRIKTQMVTFDSPRGNGPTKGLLARPADGGKRGAVVVVAVPYMLLTCLLWFFNMFLYVLICFYMFGRDRAGTNGILRSRVDPATAGESLPRP
jgi:hypothetical protein